MHIWSQSKVSWQLISNFLDWMFQPVTSFITTLAFSTTNQIILLANLRFKQLCQVLSAIVHPRQLLLQAGFPLNMEQSGVGSASKVPGQWMRFVLRLDARAVWHIRGVLLWLLQRPYLRFLPCPYPTVGTIEAWKLQADSMVRSGALARRHLRSALIKGAFTIGNLQECCHLRNRLGMALSFLEDPVLAGMMLAKGAKGLRTTLRHEAIKEAKSEALAAQKAGKQEEQARELTVFQHSRRTFFDLQPC